MGSSRGLRPPRPAGTTETTEGDVGTPAFLGDPERIPTIGHSEENLFHLWLRGEGGAVRKDEVLDHLAEKKRDSWGPPAHHYRLQKFCVKAAKAAPRSALGAVEVPLLGVVGVGGGSCAAPVRVMVLSIGPAPVIMPGCGAGPALLWTHTVQNGKDVHMEEPLQDGIDDVWNPGSPSSMDRSCTGGY